ncbi:universal stress protein [Arthrobacter mobilis]|uniref:Universal stress protein n=1 Tax=Arthrobacter mobilis TaxID=2724944 RepID=A0A7X6HFR5_9MICC|nr:universal stress protein [Arthrobacter mobilis]NKX56246.1 universal stress protein [Arthrobacter mobilis]
MADQGRQRIVVGVDGSDLSVAALRHAKLLADALGCVVEAVTAWHHQVAAGTVAPVRWNPAEDAGRVLADTLERAYGGQPPAELQSGTVQGQPAGELIEAARNARMLVLGSRGQGGFAGLLLGSVSAACVAHAPCPVLIVRAGPGEDTSGSADDS